MLPFLKRDQDASASGPVDSIKRTPDDGEDHDFMHDVAQDLIDAVHSKNAKAVAEALQAAFQLADSEPHEEGPHV